jgi:hypothetical protein
MSVPAIANVLSSKGIREANPAALAAITETERRKSVVLVQDAFTWHFEGELVLAFCELLQRLGFQPVVGTLSPQRQALARAGLPQILHGVAERNAAMLNALAATGRAAGRTRPVDDPHLSVRIRQGAALEAPRGELPQEFLASRIDELPRMDRARGFRLPPHAALHRAHECAGGRRPVAGTVQAAGNGDEGARHRLLRHGRPVRTRGPQPTTSESIYRLSWAGRVADPANAGRLAATGYSCRSQVAHVDGVALAHPIQVLLAAIKEERLAAPKADVSDRADFVDAHHEEY